jgi:hypothetical protein
MFYNDQVPQLGITGIVDPMGNIGSAGKLAAEFQLRLAG